MNFNKPLSLPKNLGMVLVTTVAIVAFMLLIILPSSPPARLTPAHPINPATQTTTRANITVYEDNTPVDTTHMPSYCSPSNYSIMKRHGSYFVRLPGGTIGDEYATQEEAEQAIIKEAADSRERFLRTGEF